MVAIIRQNTIEYRLWKKKQNDKNLRRRTKYKNLTKHYNNNCHYKLNCKSREYSKTTHRNKHIVEFIVPNNFSLVNNYTETSVFFKDLIDYIIKCNNKEQKYIFINLSQIQNLTTDALMYLLAIVTSRKKNKDNVHIAGNIPHNLYIKKDLLNRVFIDS